MPTISAVRQAKGWSQKQLAELAGVSRPIVSKLENGQAVYKSSFLAVCSALGIKPTTVTGAVIYTRTRAKPRGEEEVPLPPGLFRLTFTRRSRTNRSQREECYGVLYPGGHVHLDTMELPVRDYLSLKQLKECLTDLGTYAIEGVAL